MDDILQIIFSNACLVKAFAFGFQMLLNFVPNTGSGIALVPSDSNILFWY